MLRDSLEIQIDPGPNEFMGRAFKTWHHAVPWACSAAVAQTWVFIGGGGSRIKEQFPFLYIVRMDYLATQISNVDFFFGGFYTDKLM